MVENALIKIGEFYYPVDFIILDMTPLADSPNDIPVILGQPFLVMANANIDCWTDTMELSFGNMTMEMHVFPIGGGNIKDQSCHAIHEVERLVMVPSHFRKLVSRAEEQRN